MNQKTFCRYIFGRGFPTPNLKDYFKDYPLFLRQIHLRHQENYFEVLYFPSFIGQNSFHSK